MTRKRLFLITLGVAASAAWTPSSFAIEGVVPQGPPSEELIGEKDPSCAASDEEDIATADGRKVAWRCKNGRKWSVFVNGQRQGGTYDETRYLYFSPDGQRLAFAARRDRRWMLVLDGVESTTTYDDLGAPVFGPAAGLLAYGAKRDKRWLMVVNGNESATTYADVKLPEYSADGRHVAYAAKPAKKWTLVVDGSRLGGEFDQVLSFAFSPDGQRTAHVARRGDNLVAVVDGKEGPALDIIGGLTFSADSRRLAYGGVEVNRGFAKEKGLGRAYVDGVAGPEFEGAQIGSLLTAMATGSVPHLAEGYFVDLLPDTHGVSAPVFSPDARRVAYAARRGKDGAALIVDGEAAASFPSILDGPVFSPDSQHVAVVIADAGALSFALDGTKVGPASSADFDFVIGLMFAPDNRRVAWVTVRGGDWYDRGFTLRARRQVYVDGVPGPEYDARYLGRLGFSADGQHVAYLVGGVSVGAREVEFVVIDSKEGKHYDDILGPPRLEPDGQTIAYTARDGRKFYRVMQRMTAAQMTSAPGGAPRH